MSTPVPIPAPAGIPRRARGPRARSHAARLVIYLVLVILGVGMFLPLFWLVVTSVLPPSQAFELPPTWIPTEIYPDNYGRTFELVPFGVQIWNSVLVTVVAVAGQLVTSSLAAYAFARLRFKGRDVVFVVFLAALMIPGQVTVIPIFILMRNLGLVDNLASLWLPALLSVFAIFFLRQHFLSIPGELEEAAKIDGAGPWRILFGMFIPLSGPILTAVAIFGALATWNDFFWPNIMISSPQNMTIPLGLVYLQAGLGGAPAAVVFAAISVVMLPLLLLYLLAQDRITEGVALAGISR
jgi:multiple sugar transport system permease protein